MFELNHNPSAITESVSLDEFAQGATNFSDFASGRKLLIPLFPPLQPEKRPLPEDHQALHLAMSEKRYTLARCVQFFVESMSSKH